MSDEFVVHVAPDGDDRASGRSAATAIATPARALTLIRNCRKGSPDASIRVVLADGTYFLTSPMRLTIGGNPGAPTRWEAAPGAKPVISGGRRIDGFVERFVDGERAWIASVPEAKVGRWRFTQLIVNGEARFRPRLPREGYYRIEALPDLDEACFYRTGQYRFTYRGADLRSFHNLPDVEVVALSFWTESRMWIRSLDEAQRLVVLDRESNKNLTDDHESGFAEYYVENVREALAPGEWYLDGAEGTLIYLPLADERLETATVIAPYLEQVLIGEGYRDRHAPVRHLEIRGITFAHAEWPLPAGDCDFGQSAYRVPGAVELRHCEDVRLIDCTFEHLGSYGIVLLDACRDVRIEGCHLRELGAGGIRIWHDCNRNTVTDCEIAYGGRRFHCGVGVMVGQACGNRIVHNHIHHLYYSGISVGWLWNYSDGRAYGNVIEYNHVHDIGQGRLSDMGGIYTLGVSGGTRIRHNVFHDICSRGYGGWAIYTDEGSSDILIENNLSYRTKSAVFHQHYGRNNQIVNNIWACGEMEQLALTRLEAHRSIAFERNIVYFDSGRLFGYDLGKATVEQVSFANNLYYRADGEEIRFGELSFEAWREKGHDRGSRIADPGFADPQQADFTLSPDSPAMEVGFRPFSTREVGPRDQAKRNA